MMEWAATAIRCRGRCPVWLLLVLPLLLTACSKRVVIESRYEIEVVAPHEPVLFHTVREGESLQRIADLYYGDPARAAALARDNDIAPDTVLGAGSIVKLRFMPREYEQARRRAVALEPYNRGVAALSAGDLEEAERQFRLALHTVSDLTDARYNLALVQLKRGKADAAADLLAKLARERPLDSDIAFALGNALFQLTRYAEAAEVFTGVLVRESDHRRAAFGWARSLHAEGRRREAAAAWRRYLELDSTSSWAAEARRHLRELNGG